MHAAVNMLMNVKRSVCDWKDVVRASPYLMLCAHSYHAVEALTDKLLYIHLLHLLGNTDGLPAQSHGGEHHVHGDERG